ncbi:RNA-binding domain-containing protein [Tessaracoccus sp. OH4464_COT-324]|uniref:RNA-binding domain-containing protein n=1 Tax=Tessaracoccus sp. OH4464_COT-324 TaxID=2491059 RepID=UPI000F63CC1A|nr:RNA-binding domain-containing protein [Tessaracoccus sp. OH4464_COT-324]RRD45893.1 transcriptional regulator [Tessaracoccus sp. OH4464_COT-324]
MTRKNNEAAKALTRLLIDGEGEVVEFRETATQFSVDKIGEYVSALSNEANLRGKPYGWLVFGVSDTGRVAGTDHPLSVEQRQDLAHQLLQSIDQKLAIRDIHEIPYFGKRVLLLEIPAAPRGLPVSWRGNYRARAGQDLVPLPSDKLDEIRGQAINDDWSAATVPDATIADLDPAALACARQGFAERHASRIPSAEIDAWDDATFLSKAGLTRDGLLTRAALLLLGTSSSSRLLAPHPAQLTWRLVGEQPAEEHFSPPFLLTAAALVSRIGNGQLLLMPPDGPPHLEISKYVESNLLGALHNCIAHQDYSKNSRVIVTEQADQVTFENAGGFYDGVPSDYMLYGRTPRRYRNPFLVEAMLELNVVDRMGHAIHRTVQDQISRFLPLPDYDLSAPDTVRLTIPGTVLDEAYSHLLMQKPRLTLEDLQALDRLQRRLTIEERMVHRLRRRGFVEGRRPYYHVKPRTAAPAPGLASYARNRSAKEIRYAMLLIDFIRERGHVDRREAEKLMFPLFNEAFTDEQKSNKTARLLTMLRKHGAIVNHGTRQKPLWKLSEAVGEAAHPGAAEQGDDRGGAAPQRPDPA